MERFALQPLPEHPFEYCEYKTVKVYANPHISYQKHHYSVPYKYISQRLTLKIYEKKIQVLDGDQMVCEHPTTGKMPGGYTTNAQHMPVNSATHGQWNSHRYLNWARRVGHDVHIVVTTMFEDGPKQNHALLKLADTYSDSALNDACQRALERTSSPGYRLIKQLLDNDMSHIKSSTPENTEQSFLRGQTIMSNNPSRLQNIIAQLREMRLSTMADQLHTFYRSEQHTDFTPFDCLEVIVNEEYQTRLRNRIERYKKQASLTHTNAHLSDISYAPTRGLRKENIEQLSTNHYIHNNQNVTVQGAIGTGKIYLANALVNHAVESGFTGKYYRMNELLNDINLAEFNGNLDKLLKKLMKVDVLVIDDFLLTSTKEQEQKYLMEIFELRSREKSLIMCSQMSSAEWHKKLGGGAIADAILDRACSKS